MGCAHPDELLGRLSSRQFAEWLAWARIRGLPQDRAEFLSGQVCAVLANIHRSKEESRIFGPGDFMPMLAAIEEEEETAPEPELIDLEETSRAMMRMLGRHDKDPPP